MEQAALTTFVDVAFMIWVEAPSTEWKFAFLLYSFLHQSLMMERVKQDHKPCPNPIPSDDGENTMDTIVGRRSKPSLPLRTVVLHSLCLSSAFRLIK
jgi:hypothetical protein